MKVIFAADTSFYYFGNDYPGDAAADAAMAEARACFDRTDFSVINLETTFGEKEALTPIPKSGPNQVSAPAFWRYIEALAPDAACLANNHTMDFGEKPLRDTVEGLKERGIRPFGAGENIGEAYAPAVLEKDGHRVAVIGVCENEFGSATETTAGSAGYALGRVTAAVRAAKARGETPVVFFHGGNEYNPFPSPMKKELYRHFVDVGAAAVIAMHTHCPQGYEIYEGAPIVYSMGNFFFPATPYPDRPRNEVWWYGYMSLLSFEGNRVELDIIPYKQGFDGVHLLCGEASARFEEYMRFITAPIGDDELLRRYFDAWSIKQGWLEVVGRLLENEKSGSASVRNFFSCEAHNEVLTREAITRFEGRVEEAEKLIPHITALQEMQILALS